MKATSFILICWLSIPLTVPAQIVLSSSEILRVNTYAVMARDTNPPMLDLGFPGFGQTWDFTSLAKSEEFSSFIRSAAGTIGAGHFVNANLIIQEEDNSLQYLSKSLSSLDFIGLTTLDSIGDTNHVDLGIRILTFPSIIGTTFSDVSIPISFEVELGVDPDGPGSHGVIDSLRFRSVSMILSTMDAQGNLKIPGAEYEALRQYFRSVTIDSLFMLVNGSWQVISDLVATTFLIDSVSYDTSHVYRFFADEVSYPVAEVEFDLSDGVIHRAQWVEKISVGLTESHGHQALAVYPNPADDYVLISGMAEGSEFEIRDMDGRAVMKSKCGKNGRVSTEHLLNGIYLVLCRISPNGAVRSTVIQVRH